MGLAESHVSAVETTPLRCMEYITAMNVLRMNSTIMFQRPLKLGCKL